MRTKKEVASNGLFPETIDVNEAFNFVNKQIADVEFALERLKVLSEKLSHIDNLDGFIVEPTNFMRVCTGLKLTLKL